MFLEINNCFYNLRTDSSDCTHTHTHTPWLLWVTSCCIRIPPRFNAFLLYLSDVRASCVVSAHTYCPRRMYSAQFCTYRHQCVRFMHECIKLPFLLWWWACMCVQKGRECVQSVHCICLLGWIWAGRTVSGCTWGGGGGGGWKGGGCWALFWRLSGGPWCLRASAWVPHTLFWVNILTSGESHPLPAEHCPTDGAGGGSRQRKETHEEIWGLQRVSQLQSRKQTNM